MDGAVSRNGKETAAMAEKKDVDDKKPDDVDPEVDDTLDDDKATDDKPDDSKSTLDDAGKKALDAMKRERNATRKALAEANAKLKEYADKGKSETERLAETAEDAKTRAGKAEQNLQKLQMAMDRAPEGATLQQIRAVAKRLSGETEEDMEADADELFALLAPAKSTSDEDDRRKPPAGKPKETLRGGGDPEDEPEEMDPRKLADAIGRH